ncbi:MAG TPA: CoB--CoM heterodisulfide reductase iron-sulfur subunit A family protein [bacterium (Candidatus Stahlbacteria)]|nr:CoB--CoM heterodisulfide reductase iron-sulfur subunit A family protein [Candidatus Stahlbacteria bacterium]
MSDELRIGVFVCHCGTNIAATVDVNSVVEAIKGLPSVVYAGSMPYACSEPGQAGIKEAIIEQNLNRIVVAACTPRMHLETFRRCVESVGLNKYLVTMANIREHCSWVHQGEPDKATRKSVDLVRMAVARARHLEPLIETEIPVTQAALIIGGGIAGIQASLDLADAGYQVYLVEKEASIGGLMSQLAKTYPTMDCAI